MNRDNNKRMNLNMMPILMLKNHLLKMWIGMILREGSSEEHLLKERDKIKAFDKIDNPNPE